MSRLFQTRKPGERPVYPAKIIEVHNPLFVVEENFEGNWLPTEKVFLDMQGAKDYLKDVDSEKCRIQLYQRVSENG